MHTNTHTHLHLHDEHEHRPLTTLWGGSRHCVCTISRLNTEWRKIHRDTQHTNHRTQCAHKKHCGHIPASHIYAAWGTEQSRFNWENIGKALLATRTPPHTTPPLNVSDTKSTQHTHTHRHRMRKQTMETAAAQRTQHTNTTAHSTHTHTHRHERERASRKNRVVYSCVCISKPRSKDPTIFTS